MDVGDVELGIIFSQLITEDMAHKLRHGRRNVGVLKEAMACDSHHNYWIDMNATRQM